MESNFFRKARTYAEREHDKWFILSAKHHLLHPDGPRIEPYDETLSGARVSTKREWASTVLKDMEQEGILKAGIRLVFHAGADYYDELLPHLEDRPVEIDIPTEGLRIGEKLAWYNAQLSK